VSERYTAQWSAPARRAIGKELPEAVAAAAIELITGPLCDDPRRVGEPLREPFVGIWSARRGTYRVLYRIDETHRWVIVETVRHRKGAYQ
jgi:mRNA interferase RelE/StbE